jgi:streptomycin 6-kinase
MIVDTFSTPFHPVDPGGCARKIIDVHGSTGAVWLERLPELVAEFAARWSLTIRPPFPELSYNYVAPVFGPGGEAWVLKAGVPHDELWSEIDALTIFDGRGIARLIAADRERGVLLLERVQPGDPLKAVADASEQVAAVVNVLRRLWRPLPVDHPFRTIPDLARGLEQLRVAFGGGYGPFPAQRVERAAALFRELTGDAAPPLLIHGDMNPGNVLRTERDGWLAIDPKGYAGHPLYDVATFLNDPPPLPPAELLRLQARRVATLAEALDAPAAAVLAWAEAHATLSAWWTYHDHGVAGESALALAEMYERLSRTR